MDGSLVFGVVSYWRILIFLKDFYQFDCWNGFCMVWWLSLSSIYFSPVIVLDVMSYYHLFMFYCKILLNFKKITPKCTSSKGNNLKFSGSKRQSTWDGWNLHNRDIQKRGFSFLHLWSSFCSYCSSSCFSFQSRHWNA